jgi:putative DNA primase/helicase
VRSRICVRSRAFEPSHLLILLSNHKPRADANDPAFWDRLYPIIFTVRVVHNPRLSNERHKDRHLGHALEQEASGILTGLVRGRLASRRAEYPHFRGDPGQ